MPPARTGRRPRRRRRVVRRQVRRRSESAGDCDLACECGARQKDGVRALLVCLAGMLLYGVVWGSNGCFAVIYVYLHAEFEKNDKTFVSTKTATIGAFNTGASYLSCLAAGMLVDLFGCRILTLTGTVFTCVGTFLAAFAKSHVDWIFTFGVLTGIGNGFLFVATLAILPEYFDKRIGLANAAVSLGSGIAFIIYPLLFQYNLEQHVNQKSAAAATQPSLGASSTSPLQSTMLFICSNYLVSGIIGVYLFVPLHLSGTLFRKDAWLSGSSSQRLVRFFRLPRVRRRMQSADSDQQPAILVAVATSPSASAAAAAAAANSSPVSAGGSSCNNGEDGKAIAEADADANAAKNADAGCSLADARSASSSTIGEAGGGASRASSSNFTFRCLGRSFVLPKWMLPKFRILRNWNFIVYLASTLFFHFGTGVPDRKPVN